MFFLAGMLLTALPIAGSDRHRAAVLETADHPPG
jgi:hypothetical protein